MKSLSVYQASLRGPQRRWSSSQPTDITVKFPLRFFNALVRAFSYVPYFQSTTTPKKNRLRRDQFSTVGQKSGGYLMATLLYSFYFTIYNYDGWKIYSAGTIYCITLKSSTHNFHSNIIDKMIRMSYCGLDTELHLFAILFS